MTQPPVTNQAQGRAARPVRPPLAEVLEQARNDLLEYAKSAPDDLVISIPIWGWYGNGKTTTLLTIVGYCDESEHGVSVSLITDTDQLADLQENNPEYAPLDLVSVAIETRRQFHSKLKTFFDDREWPTGTESPTPYIFALNGSTRELGFAYLPDLPGGSFQEADEASKSVLSNSHGCIILVDPIEYTASTANAKVYQDEIHSRIRRSVSKFAIPTAVLITKSDRKKHRASADATMAALSIVVDRYDTDLIHLAQVSVIGAETETETEDPPTLPLKSERKPEQLLAAWLWLISKVFRAPRERIREVVPAVQMRSFSVESRRAKKSVIPELRQVAEYSGLPGYIACSLPTKQGVKRLLTVAADGGLYTIGLRRRDGLDLEKVIAEHGHLDALDFAVPELACANTPGALLIGRRRGAKHLWRVSETGDVVREHFDRDLHAWAPITGTRLVGLDSSGRLHHLTQKGNTWVSATSFIPEFVQPDRAILWVHPSHGEVLAFGGSEVEGAEIDGHGLRGRTGNRRQVAFDVDNAAVNASGVFSCIRSNGALVWSDGLRTLTLDGMVSSERNCFALTNKGNVVAAIQTELRLIGASVDDGKLVTTGERYVSKLPTKPSAMQWTHDDTLLVVGFPDATWSIWDAVGLK